MVKKQILVVEDESIIAMELQQRLQELGYLVPVVAYSGEEAIEQAAALQPDLVLMDIFLNGQRDGTRAAAYIRERFNIPIIYLTAYADEYTLQRAKITEPFGYILKPFEEKELHIAIKMALYKHQMENKLRQSEQWLSTTLKSIGDAVITTDFDGYITFLNPHAEALTGWRQGEALGQSLSQVFKIIREESGTSLAAAVKRVLAEKIVVHLPPETILYTKNGQSIPLDGTAAPIKDDHNRMIGVVLAFRDITERKRIEQERIEQARLTAFNRQLQVAAQVSEQINAILEPERLLQATSLLLKEKFNLKHLQIYLFDEAKEELISPSTWQAMLKPTHIVPLSKEKSLIAHVARTQKAFLLQDTKQSTDFMPASPHTRSQIAVPLIIGERLVGLLDVQDEQPNRFVPSDVDVFSTLAGQIAIALENAHLFDELKSLERLKNEFLASMSHELRTPLNSIIGYCEMLMGVNGALSRDVTEDLHVIRNSGQRLLSLINNILDFVQLKRGRMVLDPQKVKLNALLEQVLRECQPILQDKPIKLDLKIEPHLPQIEADKRRLKQILMNLVSNAIQFTLEGFIRLHAFQEEESVVLAIEDTGIGIDESELTTIFEHFRQLDGSSTRRVEGSGLGLAITLHLVQLHGGTINVKSRLREGSTFFVRLPIKQISHTDKANHLKEFTTTL